MSRPLALPLLLEAEQLLPVLQHPLLRIVDLCRPQVYEQVHLPNAVPVTPAQLVRQDDYASGLLPEMHNLQQLMQKLAITPQHHVVVYDDEGAAGQDDWSGPCICWGFIR